MGEEGSVPGFLGGAVADEPRAALAARDILSAGGTAADAAAALYFTLAVTYPGAASLGGGGMCVTYERKTGKAEMLDFLGRAPAQPGAVGVPGNVRGFAALQARYGRLRWEQALATAEQAARLGVPVSRAGVRALAAVQPEHRQALEPLLVGQDGKPLQEGDPIRQVELGTTLSRLRTAGPGDFYTGQLSRTLLQDIEGAGGTVSAEDLRQAIAVWRQPIKFEFEHITLMLPPTPGGAIVRQLWQATVAPSGLISSARTDFGAFAAALGPAYGSIDAASALNPGASSGFAVADREGNAVACVVSMQRPFGAGKLARSTGILLAAPPGPDGGENRFMAPMLAANYNVKQLFLAGAASGGAPAPAALAEAAIAALAGGKTTGDALALARLFAAGPGSPIWHEPNLDPALAGQLAQRGLGLRQVPDLARVNLNYCVNAIPRGEETCSFRADPRGFGMAAGTGY